MDKLEKYEICDVYEWKIDVVKNSVIALKSEMYADMRDYESIKMWEDVIGMLDDAESALIRAKAELTKVREG